MDLHIITADKAWENRDLLRAHSKARADIFPGWPDVNYCGGFEGDVFDQIFFNPTWVSVAQAGRTIAVGRMIPADGPCTMVEKVWAHGIDTPLPDKATAAELHRVGRLPDLEEPVGTIAVLKVQLGLMQAMQAAGRPNMFFLTPKRVAETTLRDATRHGPAIDVDGDPFFVVSATFDADAIRFMADTIAELEEGLPPDAQKRTPAAAKVAQ